MTVGRGFKRLLISATIATYILIFIGGLVRVSGAGLGCPDWPKCFGRWYPPTSIEQLPPEIDPSQFNLTLAWIEYINRLCGMTVGLLIAAAAFVALFRYRRIKRIFYPTAAAAFLTAFQGYQGSVVVSSELQPIVVSVHTILALIIVSLLTYATHRSVYFTASGPTSTGTAWKNLRPYMWALWLVALVQFVLGTRVREAIEHIIEDFPLLSETERLAEVGAINHIHMGFGLLLVVVTAVVWLQVKKMQGETKSPVMLYANTMVLLVSFQLFVGLTFVSFGRIPVLQLFHLLIATVYIGSLIMVYLSARDAGVQNE